MSTRSLFPTRIWHEPLGTPNSTRQLNADLIHDSRVIPRLDPEGAIWSKTNYPGGYTSYGSITTLHERFQPFMDLRRAIDKHVTRYAKALHWNLQGRTLKMTSCWLNIMPTGCSHSLHLHPLSVVSGTYYVQTPAGSGVLKFEDPRLGLMMAAPPRRAQAPEGDQPFVAISPRAGDLILFESWLRHEVSANRARKPRISVSFNYDWI